MQASLNALSAIAPLPAQPGQAFGGGQANAPAAGSGEFGALLAQSQSAQSEGAGNSGRQDATDSHAGPDAPPAKGEPSARPSQPSKAKTAAHRATTEIHRAAPTLDARLARQAQAAGQASSSPGEAEEAEPGRPTRSKKANPQVALTDPASASGAEIPIHALTPMANPAQAPAAEVSSAERRPGQLDGLATRSPDLAAAEPMGKAPQSDRSVPHGPTAGTPHEQEALASEVATATGAPHLSTADPTTPTSALPGGDAGPGVPSGLSRLKQALPVPERLRTLGEPGLPAESGLNGAPDAAQELARGVQHALQRARPPAGEAVPAAPESPAALDAQNPSAQAVAVAMALARRSTSPQLEGMPVEPLVARSRSLAMPAEPQAHSLSARPEAADTARPTTPSATAWAALGGQLGVTEPTTNALPTANATAFNGAGFMLPIPPDAQPQPSGLGRHMDTLPVRHSPRMDLEAEQQATLGLATEAPAQPGLDAAKAASPAANPASPRATSPGADSPWRAAGAPAAALGAVNTGKPRPDWPSMGLDDTAKPMRKPVASAERAGLSTEPAKAPGSFKSESVSRSAQSVGLSAQQVVADLSKAGALGAMPESSLSAAGPKPTPREWDSMPVATPWAAPTVQSPEFKLATPTTQADLPTPVQSPEFPAALAAQVTVFAQNGTQSAQLHLNPAEMGPISIQIEIQGQQAKVEFGAESSVTRGIIEQGLPALAAALSEAGLTLSGGGVSQQSQQPSQQAPSQQEQADAGESARSRASRVSARNRALEAEPDHTSPLTPRASPRRPHASGLDVFA